MDFANLTDEQLEVRLLELAFDASLGGRAVESRKSAIRTVLARRAERREATDVDATTAQAVELVNAIRPPDRRVTVEEMNRVDAASILGDETWAQLFATPAECEEISRRRKARTWHPVLPDGGPDVPHGASCAVCAEARR